MQILNVEHVSLHPRKPLYPHKYANSQHCTKQIVRSLSHFCSFFFLWKSFWLNHIYCKWTKIVQRVPKLGPNPWLQGTTVASRIWAFHLNTSEVCAKFVLVIFWPILYSLSVFWIFFGEFGPSYLWHNRDRVQASICSPSFPRPPTFSLSPSSDATRM